MKTDIVVTSCRRVDYLKRTLEGIFNHTRTPYSLHVVDDAADDKSSKYLLGLWRGGKIRSLLLRKDRCGLRAGHNVGFWLSFSDPMVFTDDDVLCPDLNPDWLARGLKAMKENPKLGVLALNNPARHMLKKGHDRPQTTRKGEVTYCPVVGGTFAFVRRKVLVDWKPRHVQGQGVPVPVPDGSLSRPATERCRWARKLGFSVGYLTEVYCFHFGEKSIRRDKKEEKILKPVDMKTLRPPERWAW